MTKPRRQISLAHLTALDLAPDELIPMAASAGYDGIGLRLLQVTPQSPYYPLHLDQALMRRTKEALQQTGIMLNDFEFVKITADLVVAELTPLLAAAAELGAAYLITAPYDDDHQRLADKLAALGELAAPYKIKPVLEFFPWTSVANLTQCLEIVQASGHAAILVDALHFNRSQSSLTELASINPQLIPFAHFCDAPVMPHYSYDELIYAARDERLLPGQGGIDLLAFLKALPASTKLGLEIPSRHKITNSKDGLMRLTAMRQACLSLLAKVNEI